MHRGARVEPRTQRVPGGKREHLYARLRDVFCFRANFALQLPFRPLVRCRPCMSPPDSRTRGGAYAPTVLAEGDRMPDKGSSMERFLKRFAFTAHSSTVPLAPYMS
ncbi:hypothetical protein CSUI_006084 [Cystoisospora suis]|uniref:Uncharacterized protein n=1 Tax=Cystoisospora suis TaxID=483139 RepID=A0A2C6KRK4_9APIC|nr:hypothetical protein CSUI_006084 [Cystoisospora suis]